MSDRPVNSRFGRNTALAAFAESGSGDSFRLALVCGAGRFAVRQARTLRHRADQQRPISAPPAATAIIAAVQMRQGLPSWAWRQV